MKKAMRGFGLIGLALSRSGFAKFMVGTLTEWHGI
jgi:hypothetical protein